MDLQNLTLEDWLKSPPQSAFKNGGDPFPYYSKYDTFKNYLDTHVHPQVTKQAIYTEYTSGKDIDKIIFLNDHGPEHIKTVIQKAGELLSNSEEHKAGCILNVREVFFLLNAIQVHDVGNYYGRLGHESKILKTIKEGLTPILFDAIEAIYIQTIAQVHGGTIKYKNGTESKDTISSIKREVMSDSYPIKMPLLASILRFADELADNKYRADVKALDDGRIPKGSEIFHAYAACLDSVKVAHTTQTVELHFKVPKDYLTRTFGKIQKNETVSDEYLIDEIYKRALKVHTELMYCSKFWKKYISLDKVWIQIEFYSRINAESWDENDLNFHPDITFTLDDYGYPNTNDDIFSQCPKELLYRDGTKMDGYNISQKIESVNKNQ